MSTTTVTGTINGVNNTALANKWITFRLLQLGTDSGSTATVAQSVDSIKTDTNGDFSIDLWNNGSSGKKSVLEIIVNGSRAEYVIIPEATASIELWDLIENYQADGSTSEQVPVVSELFVRKSNNLSDLGSAATSRTNLDVPSNTEAVLVANNLSELTPTASTSRTNLGVAIGTDVQAHSAILDNTTASFTTADEIKLDGIEALADVTDATNIAASGGYVAGGTDVALTDGGTGASDATTARTNLGVAIGSNVQAHSAILDATTASFTVAEESKLSGIEALAEVNDPTTVLDADIGLTVQAHSAILDATTASFTTAKDTAISTNTASIASNDTDIATNVTNIATNATNIATNVTNIALKSPVDNPTFTGTINTSATGIDFNAGNLGGELSWNDTEKTLDLATGSDSVTLQLGQEVVLYVRNTTGVTLSDGQVVAISGSQGNKPTVALAQADTVENAGKTIGVVTQTIPDNSDGFVTLIGKVRGLVLDVGTYTEGDVVYLSSTVAGGITVVEPDISVEIGHVLATSTGGNTAGVLEVQVHNGVAIHELEQVVVANTAAIALNTAKVTNATHTGDVTGDTALTISTDAVDIPMLSASGTPDATTFLRGDNTWSVPASGNTAVEYPYTTDFQSGVSQTRDLSGTLTAASGGYNSNANLTSLYIGSKITQIDGDSVFFSVNLIDVTIPNSVTVIGDSSFLGCTGLTSIIIPDSVLDIQGSAFSGCTGIASVTIGKNVSQIRYGAFSGCNNVGFTEVVIPDSVQIIANTAFESCTALTSVTLPNNPSFVLLDAQTFLGCVALTSIIIPESVTTIGAEAFRDCTALGSISCLSTVAPTLVGSDVFLNVLATTIDVPIGSAGYGVTYGGLTVNYVL
jgi:hypothetical protein